MGERITAEEFTEACVYLREEPLDPAVLGALGELLAALANGPLTKSDKTLWSSSDFLAPRWQPSAQTTPGPAGPSAAEPPTAAELRSLFSNLLPR